MTFFIAGTPPDGSWIYDAAKQVVSAAAGIPERVLFGSERGQLAGEQDSEEWDTRSERRRNQHVTPNIVRRTLDYFILTGILPEPKGSQFEVRGRYEYEVEWEPIRKPSPAEEAEIAKNVAEAAKAVSPGGNSPDLVIAPWEFRRDWLGLPEEMSDPPPGYLFDDRGDEE